MIIPDNIQAKSASPDTEEDKIFTRRLPESRSEKKTDLIHTRLFSTGLKNCYEPNTRRYVNEIGKRYRVQVLDGHVCHLTTLFIDFCLANRILIAFVTFLARPMRPNH